MDTQMKSIFGIKMLYQITRGLLEMCLLWLLLYYMHF